jgi:hypothetical protein
MMCRFPDEKRLLPAAAHATGHLNEIMQNAFDIMGICPAVLFSSNLLRLCLKQNARAPGLENKKHLKRKKKP